jgi:hypothetical protein
MLFVTSSSESITSEDYKGFNIINTPINEKLKKKTDVKFDYDQDPADISNV